VAKRQRIGNPVGSSSTKKNTTFDTCAITRGTRTLIVEAVVNIPKSNTDNEIDQRQRQIVNLRGFKHCLMLENLSADPVLANWAVIIPKDKTEFALTATNRFFRGTGNARGLDFGNDLCSNDFRCRPINTDKFTVLRHKRFVLGPGGANTIGWSNQRQSYRTNDYYMKINRQFRFSQGEDVPEQQLFIVHWYDVWGAPSGSPVAPGVVRESSRVISYFKEPCC
jgi:hypothetical protein